MIETDVLIVGGGPVGLTLAMDLAQRGIEVTVLELRRRGEPPSVKCNHVAARSMELFRRLGVARAAARRGLARRLPERRLLPHDDARDGSSRASRSPAGATATRPRAAPTPGGRRPSRRTGSTRSFWSRSSSSTPASLERVTHPQPRRILRASRRTRRASRHRRARSTRARRSPSRRAILSAATAADRDACAGRSARSSLGDPVVQRVQSSYIRAPELLALLRKGRALG